MLNDEININSTTSSLPKYLTKKDEGSTCIPSKRSGNSRNRRIVRRRDCGVLINRLVRKFKIEARYAFDNGLSNERVSVRCDLLVEVRKLPTQIHSNVDFPLYSFLVSGHMSAVRHNGENEQWHTDDILPHRQPPALFIVVSQHTQKRRVSSD